MPDLATDDLESWVRSIAREEIDRTSERPTPVRLLTTKQAAAALGLSPSKVRALVAAGTIPSVHIGASRRIPADRLAEYVESLERGA